MAIVKVPVPKPPKSAFNPERRVSALLKNQIIHLQEAEFRLPANRQTNVYINSIKTERDAANYIAQVTAALHGAHGVEPRGMSTPAIGVVRRRRAVRGPDIAAMADDKPARKRKSARKNKTKAKAKIRRKK